MPELYHVINDKGIIENEDRLKEDFERIAKIGHPKIVSFNEADEQFIISNQGSWRNTGCSILESYGWAWLDRAWQTSDMPELEDTHAKWNEWNSIPDNNTFFHACKIQWLVHCIQTEGLYSVPQAILKASKWYTHPGQFRVHAIEYTECNEDFVVWDINERLTQPEINFDQWWELYNHYTDKSVFVVPFEDKLEVHVGEEREELYHKCLESYNVFKGTKPILEGTCDEKLSDLFEHGTYEGHGIGIVGDFKFKDLKHMMSFDSSKQSIEKNNFVLYNNYHK